MKRNILRKRILIPICLMALFIITSFSPELVIRGNLLLRLHPIQSLAVDISEVQYDKQNDSYMYAVDDYEPYQWFVPEVFRGPGKPFWYLKKTRLGFYYVYKGASNP